MPKDLKYDVTARDKTGRAFQSVRSNVDKMRSSFGGLKTAVAGAFAVAGIAAFVKSTVNAGDQIQKLAIATGASTEHLSQMRHAAELTGTSFDAYAKGLQKLQKSTSDAANGLATPKRAFEQLGIEVEHFKSLARRRWRRSRSSSPSGSRAASTTSLGRSRC